MSTESGQRYRVGQWIDDRCRPCSMVRRHTVLAASPEGRPLRVLCDHCGSQHNYRGGERAAPPGRPRVPGEARPAPSTEPFPIVSERERTGSPVSYSGAEDMSTQDLELLLRKVIREESGLTPVEPSDKWRGGEMVLKPGREGLQEKSIPIETFFSKIVMVRNRLRVLEQQVNQSELPNETKAKLQGYITASYGSLTSFNILFADEDDRFKGAGGKS